MTFLSIWSIGAEGFANNSAARAMIYITFYAIASSLLLWLTQLAGGKAKMAGYAIVTLGGIACLGVFVEEVIKLVNIVGKALGL